MIELYDRAFIHHNRFYYNSGWPYMMMHDGGVDLKIVLSIRALDALDVSPTLPAQPPTV